MLSRILLLAFGASLGTVTAAQGFQLQYGGSQLQDAVAVFGDATGYTTVVRETYPTDARVRVQLLRTSLQGLAPQWYDVPLTGTCFVQAAVMAGDGNIVLCGSSIAPGRSDQDALLAKVSPTGSVLWTWTSGDAAAQEELYGLQRTADGAYIACGMRRADADSDALLVRTDADGALQWSQHYGTGTDEMLRGVSSDADGYVAVGRITNFGGDLDTYIVRTDLNGTQQWWQSWGGIKDDELYGIARSGSNYVMAGRTDSYGPLSFGTPVRSAYLMAMNADGDTLWTRTFGNVAAATSVESLTTATNGDLVLVGRSGNDHFTDAMVMRVNSSGSLVWQNTYDVAIEDALHTLSMLSDGGFIAAGRTFADSGGQAILVRKNSFGQ
jgi:hypothetical protein